MHLHCHLEEIILDFGPIYGFWLFSFEHYNGFLGNYPTNRKDIESQLFRRFVNDFCILDLKSPAFLSSEMENVFSKLKCGGKQRGTLLSQSGTMTNLDVVRKSSSKCIVSETECDLPSSYELTIRSKKVGVVSQNEMPYLREMYRNLYDSISYDDDFIICPSYQETKEIYFMENILGFRNGRSKMYLYMS